MATAEHRPLDRPVRRESLGFWRETLARWQNEGLPEHVQNEIAAHVHFGFDLVAPIFLGAHEHPGLDPLFAEEILEQDSRITLKRNFAGAIVRVFTDGQSTPPTHLDFPVKDQQTWEKIKARLDPKTPGRLAPFLPFIELARTQAWSLEVYLPGLFGTHRHLLGFERLMISYSDQPELLHQISRHWVRLWKNVIAQIRDRHRPDMVYLWEDMCGKNGPLIGPKTFAAFMSPYYLDLIGFLKNELGVPVVGVDTDGDMSLLIPKFVDAGVNLLLPFEVQAGMDVIRVREEWPEEFVIWGGMDKRALARDKKAIADEVKRVLPRLLKQGRYIPAIDHAVPPDVSLENWNFFLDLVRETGEKFYGTG